MTYLDGPRFVVRELEGYASMGKRRAIGFTLTVVDRAYCSQVLRMWRLEEQYSGGPFSTKKDPDGLRAEAEAYAASLNAGGRCTGGLISGDSLLSPGTVLPSLSPFDSGCPQ